MFGCVDTSKHNERCTGRLVDSVLDWDQALAPHDNRVAEDAADKATLSIALGTSLQIEPAASFAVRLARRRKVAFSVCRCQC